MFRPLLDIQWGIRSSMLYGLPKANNLINHSPNRTCIKIQNKIFEKYFNFKPHVEHEGWCVCTVHFFHLFFHCIFLKDDIVHNKSLPLVPKVTAENFWIHNGSHGDLWFISGLLKIQISGGLEDYYWKQPWLQFETLSLFIWDMTLTPGTSCQNVIEF